MALRFWFFLFLEERLKRPKKGLFLGAVSINFLIEGLPFFLIGVVFGGVFGFRSKMDKKASY